MKKNYFKEIFKIVFKRKKFVYHFREGGKDEQNKY